MRAGANNHTCIDLYLKVEAMINGLLFSFSNKCLEVDIFLKEKLTF